MFNAPRFGSRYCQWVTSICLLVGAVGTVQSAENHWLSGAALHERLQQPTSVYFSRLPLREALQSISRSHNVALLLDRRIDPDQPLDVAIQDTPLVEAIAQVAREAGAEVAWIGPIGYVGPPQATGRVRTVAEIHRQQASKIGGSLKSALLAAAPVQWNDFATPRRLLEQAAEQAGVSLDGLERVPHDLWAGTDLPPVALTDRLTLILIQFDLGFVVRAKSRTLELVPLPERVQLVQRFPGKAPLARHATQWRSMLPNCEIEAAGRDLVVRGRLEDLERLQELMQGSSTKRTRTASPAPAARSQLARKRFTVRRAQGPLEDMLRELASGLGMELRIDRAAFEAAGIALDRPVSFSVENATFDELFRAVLDPVGCTYRRSGNVIEVWPAEPRSPRQ